MARPPQVTRTVIHTECICQCVDINTGTIFGKIVNLPGIVTSSKKQLQQCKAKIEGNGRHVLRIERIRYLKTFALQTPTDFIEKGKILSQTELKADEIYKERED